MKFYYGQSCCNSSECFLLGFFDDDNIKHSFLSTLSTDFAFIGNSPYFKSINCDYEKDGKFYAEVLLDKTYVISDPRFEQVDMTADSWSDEAQALLLDWVNHEPISLNTIAATTHVTGDLAAIREYQKSVFNQVKKIIFTKHINGSEVILGFLAREGSTLADGKIISETLQSGAYQILNDNKTYKMLCDILGVSCDGFYCISSSGAPYAYALLPDSIDDTLDIMVMSINDCPDSSLRAFIESEDGSLSNGFDIDSMLRQGNQIDFAKFKSSTGDSVAIGRFNEITKPRLYIKNEDGADYFFAAYIDGSYITLADVIYTPYTLEAIETISGIKFVGDFSKGTIGPVCRLLINTKDISDSVKLLNFSDIPVNVSKMIHDAYERMTTEGIAVVDLTTDIENATVQGMELFNISRAIGDDEAIQAYESLRASIYPIQNTVAQLKPTSEFSRSLPNYSQLEQIYGKKDIKDVLNIEDNVDSETEASETSYFSSTISEDTGTTSATEMMSSYTSYEDLDMHIDEDGVRVREIFKFCDCFHLRRALEVTKSTVNPKLIEGDPNNNTLSLCENELKFYMNVRHLILYGISKEQGIYTVDGLTTALLNGVSSDVVDKFLKDMANDAYSLNWAHTGHVCKHVSFSEDDDSNSESGIQYLGYYNVIAEIKGDKISYSMQPDTSIIGGKTGAFEVGAVTDGWNRILAYMQNYVINSLGWLECFLRLLRWGARKPSSLFVPSLAKKRMFLDMQSLEISEFSGSFEVLTPLEYELDDKRASYTVYSAIVAEISADNVADIKNRYNIDLAGHTKFPCGIILATTYAESELTRYTFIDLFTAATLISRGELNILGINYDSSENKFSCSKTGCVIKENPMNERDTAYETEYIPDEYFVMDDNYSYALHEALSKLTGESQYFAVYPCKFMLKQLNLLGSIFPGVSDAYDISVFAILRYLQVAIDWDMIADCKEVVNVAAKSRAELDSYKQSVRVSHRISNKDMMANIILSESVLPLFAELASTLSTTSLAGVLDTALRVLQNSETRQSSATKITESISFDSVINNCKCYYRFLHPITKEPVFYGAVPKIEGKIVLWSPSDYTLNNVSYEDKSVNALYSSYIKPEPICRVWKAALSAGASSQAKLAYENMLKNNFIMPSLNTYTQALLICQKISKELKSK